jgi:hypothetical protein
MTAPIFGSTRRFRTVMNLWPPYWGTGISVGEVAPDWRRLVVRMRQRFYNMNAFGTHFGGNLYAMCDPHYALLLIPLLGRGYQVWDRAAAIDFVQPGRGTVQAVFDWDDAQLAEIRARTADGAKFEPQRVVEVKDEAGGVVARVHKTLYVRKRSAAT